MWLQPPFFWMGAPQPEQGLVLAAIQLSLRSCTSLFTAATSASHSFTWPTPKSVCEQQHTKANVVREARPMRAA